MAAILKCGCMAESGMALYLNMHVLGHVYMHVLGHVYIHVLGHVYIHVPSFVSLPQNMILPTINYLLWLYHTKIYE